MCFVAAVASAAAPHTFHYFGVDDGTDAVVAVILIADALDTMFDSVLGAAMPWPSLDAWIGCSNSIG